MQKSIRLFMYCGLSTLFWGVMFGGYFGDFIDVFSKVYLHRPVTVKPVWFAPLNEPMRLLVFSMLFGLIHMFLGMGLKGYMLLRDRKYLDFFCDVVLWFLLLMGLILIFIPSSMFRSISQMDLNLSPAVIQVGKWMAIIGAVGILFMSGRAPENPGHQHHRTRARRTVARCGPFLGRASKHRRGFRSGESVAAGL